MRTFGICVLLLLLAPSHPASAGAFPWRAGDAPPVVAGLALGDSREKVENLLGAPDVVEPVGTGFKLDFKAAGLAVLLTDDRGIGVIILSKTEAGNVDGLHVGNKCTDVIAKWGNPGDVYGTQAVYAAGTWGVVLERDLQNHIVSIALTNIASNKTEQADQAK